MPWPVPESSRKQARKQLARPRKQDPRKQEFFDDLNVAVLSERRVYRPYGLDGGEPGQRGKNIFIPKDGRRLYLGGKNEIHAGRGDRIRILAPGGGYSRVGVAS